MRFTISLPDELYTALVSTAETNNRSLTRQVKHYVEEGIERETNQQPRGGKQVVHQYGNTVEIGKGRLYPSGLVETQKTI